MDMENKIPAETAAQPETVKLWARIGVTINVPYAVYEQLQNEEEGSKIMRSILKGQIGETYLDGETYFPDIEENRKLAEVEFNFYEPGSKISFIDAPETTKSFYYTFGTAFQFPFKKGWIEVQAENRTEADRMFRKHFPDFNEGILNCSSIYEQDKFEMLLREVYKDAPDWRICHGTITSAGLTLNSQEKESLASKIQSAQGKASSVLSSDAPGKDLRDLFR